MVKPTFFIYMGRFLRSSIRDPTTDLSKVMEVISEAGYLVAEGKEKKITLTIEVM